MSRNIQIREPGNNYADVLHPETNSGMVLMANGRTLQEDRDSHLAENRYHWAHGVNDFVITTGGDFQYVEGAIIRFGASTTNTGAVTLNVDGKDAKPLRHPATYAELPPGRLKQYQYYEAIYNSGWDCFFIKASAEGNATADSVLAGKTFSNDAGTGLTGTMSNQGAKIITPGTTNKAIPSGYHNGQGYVVGSPNLVASNIKRGVNIFGVTGTFFGADIFGEAKYSVVPGALTITHGPSSQGSTRETVVDYGSPVTMLVIRNLGSLNPFEVYANTQYTGQPVSYNAFAWIRINSKADGGYYDIAHAYVSGLTGQGPIGYEVERVLFIFYEGYIHLATIERERNGADDTVTRFLANEGGPATEFDASQGITIEMYASYDNSNDGIARAGIRSGTRIAFY